MDYYRYRGRLPFHVPNEGQTLGMRDLTENIPNTVSVSQLQSINEQLNTYDLNTSLSTITSYLGGQGCKVWATPTYNACAERLLNVTAGTNGVGLDGRFARGYIDVDQNNYGIKPSNFPDCTPNRVWYAMSIWINATDSYLGTAFINYKQVPASLASAGPGLAAMFYPHREQFTECFVLHGDGSNMPTGRNETFNHSDSATMFSSDMQIGTSGYNTRYSRGGLNNCISYNDGLWGYREGSTLDGNSLNFATSLYPSFGFGNFKSSDTSATTIYWGIGNSYSNQTTYRCAVWTMFN